MGPKNKLIYFAHSVTRWFSIIMSLFCNLEQKKFAHKHEIFAKVGSQFCQILNSYSRNDQKCFKIMPNSEISPNLVTLFAHQRDY